MRNRICMAVLLAAGIALTSQAVVIHWSTDGYGSLEGTISSAQLVYVSTGTPAFSFGVLANGVAVGDAVTGLAITPVGVGEQATTDESRSSGNYYVVLFNEAGNQFAYGTTELTYTDTSSITKDAMTPATSVYSPNSFTGWTPIPEPSSAALFGLGAAAWALRRRRKG